jgi:hypothetical protein
MSADKKYFHFELNLYFKNGRINIGNGIFEIFKTDESERFSDFYELKKVKISDLTDFRIKKDKNFFMSLYEDVKNSVLSGDFNMESFYDALFVVEIINKIYDSAKNKKFIYF